MRRGPKAGLAATAGLGGLLVGVSVVHLGGKPGGEPSGDPNGKGPDKDVELGRGADRHVGPLPTPAFADKAYPASLPVAAAPDTTQDGAKSALGKRDISRMPGGFHQSGLPAARLQDGLATGIGKQRAGRVRAEVKRLGQSAPTGVGGPEMPGIGGEDVSRIPASAGTRTVPPDPSDWSRRDEARLEAGIDAATVKAATVTAANMPATSRSVTPDLPLVRSSSHNEHAGPELPSPRAGDGGHGQSPEASPRLQSDKTPALSGDAVRDPADSHDDGSDQSLPVLPLQQSALSSLGTEKVSGPAQDALRLPGPAVISTGQSGDTGLPGAAPLPKAPNNDAGVGDANGVVATRSPSPTPALPRPAFGLQTAMARDPSDVGSASVSRRDEPIVREPGTQGHGAVASTTVPGERVLPASGETGAQISGEALVQTLKSTALALPKPAFGLADGSEPSAGMRLAEPRGLPFTPDDELILEFRTAQGEVAETITAYGNRAAVYLPLGEIARLLDLALVVSDDGRYASGWILDEKDTITLNARARVKNVAGTEAALGPHDAQAFDGEMYLRSDLFALVMPLDVKVDLRAQTVTVRTQRPFPFEQRSQREAAREKLASRNKGQSGNAYPREATPYRAVDVPLGEVELRGVSDEARGTRAEADLRLAGDLAYMTAQAYLGMTTQEGLTSARLTLGRRDLDRGLLGPFHASAFELGDVSTEALGLGLRGIAGRGAMVSNAPIERASVFDRVDLRGELPDGYEAELYRNNTLVASTRTSVNGRYEFLQIPVEFGLNVLRVVLYGPQGQRRETVRQISVGDGRLARGELLYSFSAAQKDVNLLGLRPPEFVPGFDYGRWRAGGQIAYGVNSAVTATLGGVWYDSDSGKRWLATSGLRTGFRSIAGQLNLGLNDQEGLAIETRLAGTVQGLGWNVLHAEYAGIFSDEVRAFTSEPLARASEADLTGTLRLGKTEAALAIPFAAKVRRIEFADHKVQLDASLRASMVVSRLLVSNALSLAHQQSVQMPGRTELLGEFNLGSLSSGRTRYRAGIGYSLAPRARVNRFDVEVDRLLGPATMIKIAAGRSFASRETVLSASAIHRIGPVTLALDGRMALPRNEHSAVFRLGFSFGRNPVTKSWFMAEPGMTAGGAVAVTAYVDGNGNRHFDDGEALIEGAEIDTGTQVVRTGTTGTALIGQLGNANRTFLRLNAESLPDIAMAPAVAGVELVPRPGRIHVTAFAVEMLGDIEGTAMFGKDQRGVSGLVLLLFDTAGKQVARVRTSSGGVFLFEQVHPGTYQIMLDPDQAHRLALQASAKPSIHLDGRTPLIRVVVPVNKVEGY